MNADELKAWIVKEKHATWENMRYMLRASPDELRNAGYRGKTNVEATVMVFQDAIISIEKAIVKWEKENPDKD